MWVKRQNGTYRPYMPLTSSEEVQPVGQLREFSDKSNTKELKLFLEVELNSDSRPIAPPKKTTEDILLFFKLYDPWKEELRYVGRLFVKLSGKPNNGILTKLNKMAGFNPNEKIDLFEEIKFAPRVMCIPIDKEATFRDSQLQDGDIICFQKSQAGISEQCRYPDVRSFLEYLREHPGGPVKAQQEPNPIGSQTTISDAQVTAPPPTPGNHTQEQSTQVAAPSAVPGEPQEKVDLVADTNINPQAVTLVTFSTESSQQNEQVTHMANHVQEEAKTTTVLSASGLAVDTPSIQPPHQEITAIESTIDSSSFSFFDALFVDIRNLLERKTSEADTLSRFQPSALSIDEIANAKKILKQCLGMTLANVIKMARTTELKNSISVLLNVNAFPNRMVDKITKFHNEFNQNCERYTHAEQDLKEVEQKESLVGELKTTLKQLSSEFIPIRNQADKVHQEIADLERQLAEKKGDKAQIWSNLEDLARQATTSKQALINVENEMRLFRPKKEEAEKTVGDMERSWQSLMIDCFLILL
ncbi:Ubiquitin carboxyl-terminal hydrolase 7, ICP0-binding domain containing protein [Trema orientale]|uniref:Ubiquitin carboxyl-terminal hydrolase 7, ICP0-binding domain containing protein n=1 Tax=Trema orientale TaxID=63057 RepID=A0A2P5EAH7_TREOI|nr:Ubiquitin carboxyl-terminal hydrolase 7, ICP0-binding domain containing protein [Trema orientale]